MSKYCVSCGTANANTANVCVRCGKMLSGGVPIEQPDRMDVKEESARIKGSGKSKWTKRRIARMCGIICLYILLKALIRASAGTEYSIWVSIICLVIVVIPIIFYYKRKS